MSVIYYLFIHSFMYLFLYFFIYLFICLFVCLFIYLLFIYLFTSSQYITYQGDNVLSKKLYYPVLKYVFKINFPRALLVYFLPF